MNDNKIKLNFIKRINLVNEWYVWWFFVLDGEAERWTTWQILILRPTRLKNLLKTQDAQIYPTNRMGFCKVIHIHIYTYINKYFTCYLTLLLEYLYLHTKLNKNFQTFEVTDVSPCLLSIDDVRIHIWCPFCCIVSEQLIKNGRKLN